MAFLTLTELQNIFYEVTVTSTGLPAKRVRQAYQGQSQPAWGIDENVAFIHVSQKDDAYDKKRNYSWYTGYGPTDSRQTVNYTRVIQVDWSIYGPSCFDNADALRNGILLEQIRNIMSAHDIYPLTDIAAPRRVPYLFNGQWWDRTDLRAYFNCATTRSSIVPLFSGAHIDIDSAGGDRVVELPSA